MNKSILMLAFVCAVQVLSAQNYVSGSITSGGLVRDYIVYVPSIYTGNEAVPLVLNLHGYSSNNLEQAFYGSFAGIADTANFLVVHPNGTIDGTGNRHWNTFLFNSSSVDDVTFLRDLIVSLSGQYKIDPNRIYCTGMSNGGFMSYTLACDLSDRIAAIASVTGSMVKPKLTACTPNRPVPVLQIHGTADAVVPFDGSNSLSFIPIPELVDAWVAKNNCNPTPVKTDVPNTNLLDLCTAEHYVYGDGDQGSTVEFYKVLGGGHTWPGAVFNVGVTNQDFDASKEIWRFFSQYRLDQLTSTNDALPINTQWTLAPNPVGDWLSLSSTKGGDNLTLVQILDITGRVLQTTGDLKQTNINIETAQLKSGMYLLTWQTDKGQRLNKTFIKH